MQGLCNGNVGIIRTAVAEIVPEKELQPRAFSIMPLVWTVGSIFGPAVGGSLVHPVERFPAVFRNSKLFAQYPFALPNVLVSALFITGVTLGFLFLRESLEDRKHKRDYGIILGQLLTGSCSRRKQRNQRVDSAEADPFLPESGSQMSTPSATPTKKKQPVPITRQTSDWSQVFSRQSNINLAVYTFLAMHSVAYDQLLPIFMHHPVQSSKAPGVHLPLQFAGGFGIDSERIGFLFMVYGIYGMIIQFAIFPVLAKKFGVLNCLKGCALMFPLVYIATPFTALLPTNAMRQGATVPLMMVKGFCAIFSFPCSTILLTNSASSLKVLGTLNGVATSISAIGRAAGPALAGYLFTRGVDMGYVIVSWWFLAAVAITGAIPIWMLVEMEGFSSRGNADELEEEEESEIEDGKATSSELHDGAVVRKTSSPAIAVDGLVESPEDAIDESAILTQTVSRGSASWDRRESLDLRRVPSPIGLGAGIGGNARRYSSDLGATRSGLGTGGTSYH